MRWTVDVTGDSAIIARRYNWLERLLGRRDTFYQLARKGTVWCHVQTNRALCPDYKALDRTLYDLLEGRPIVHVPIAIARRIHASRPPAIPDFGPDGP